MLQVYSIKCSPTVSFLATKLGLIDQFLKITEHASNSLLKQTDGILHNKNYVNKFLYKSKSFTFPISFLGITK